MKQETKSRGKKVRSTSVSQQVKVFVEAAKGLPPIPSHIKLGNADKPYFYPILRTKPREFWTDEMMFVAWTLAKTQRMIVQEQALVEKEGAVINRKSRGFFQNPRIRLVRQLNDQMAKLIRVIRMNSTAGEDRLAGKREQAYKLAAEAKHEEEKQKKQEQKRGVVSEDLI